MSFIKLSILSLYAAAAVAPLLLMPPPARAACAMTDVSLQLSIHGSQSPTPQSNLVSMGSNDDCWGNTTTNTSTQLYVGSGAASQQRTSQQFVGGTQPSPLSQFGITNPVVRTQISVPIDVYSPAHDPSFFGSFSSPFQP
jgi:hypothetical protein